ncbi:Alcohol dehydrogenase [Fusarium odoratissimum]|uniref:Alcohol dehydrogenase n=1 Tax=Fusarium oxysporum f. sp. cubense (strain race 4) TaxID=2502994 RepID=N1RUT7_FUSC4|nr:Alcohol dehydrogenase [Fusarium odoratissimum]
MKLLIAGLCHSDLNRVYGTLPLISDIVGHEGVGMVVKAGSAATAHMINKRVGLGWLSRPCMECEVCDVEYTSCPKQQNLGRDVPGTFQPVDAAFVHLLPDNLQSDIAAPLLCGNWYLYVLCYQEMQFADRQLAVDLWCRWLTGTSIARAQGYRVIAVDTGEDKRRICLQFGAAHFIDLLTQNVPAEVKRLTSLGVHGVICTAGSIAAYQQAAHCVRNAGTIVCIGVNPQNLPISPLDMVRLRLIGSAVGTLPEMQELFQLAARGEVKPLITVVPIDQINIMAKKLEKGQVNGRIVWKSHSKYQNTYLVSLVKKDATISPNKLALDMRPSVPRT